MLYVKEMIRPWSIGLERNITAIEIHGQLSSVVQHHAVCFFHGFQHGNGLTVPGCPESVLQGRKGAVAYGSGRGLGLDCIGLIAIFYLMISTGQKTLLQRLSICPPINSDRTARFCVFLQHNILVEDTSPDIDHTVNRVVYITSQPYRIGWASKFTAINIHCRLFRIGPCPIIGNI